MHLFDQVRRSSWATLLVVCMLWCVACWVTVALITYQSCDPSSFHYDSSIQQTQNKAGQWGAQLAALIYFLFGSAGLLFIPFLFFCGIQLLLMGSWYNFCDQIFGWLLLLIVAPMIGAWHHTAVFKTGYIPGGACGDTLVSYLRYRDQYLVGIVLYALCLGALVLISRAYVLHGIMYLMQYALPVALLCAKKISSICVKILNWVGYWLKQTVVEVIWPDDEIGYELMNESLIEKKDFPTAQFDSIAQEPIEQQKVPHEKPLKQEIKNIKKQYQNPPVSLFSHTENVKEDAQQAKRHDLLANVLQEKLERFGIHGKVVGIKSGPVVTLFEYQPEIDAKVSRIIALEDDLALALQATTIRIIAPIPGKSLVGFEVANQVRLPVSFASIMHSPIWHNSTAHLPLVLGADTVGCHVVVDLASMPHLLIAGATGSGKSVALNAMIVSLLCKKKPEDLRIILIDPKRLEFTPYAGIAHLLFPIVDDSKYAGFVLRWVVQEMERRYELMAGLAVRHIYDYQKLSACNASLEKLPFIVIIIDELSDLMMVVGKEIELRIARIAQMARAAGIHLIIATQRPSVDVLTGIIKVNFPSRISFKVSSKTDSRIILDCQGADKLLGKGDMLYLDTASALKRIHGAYIADEERAAVVNFIRSQSEPHYLSFNTDAIDDESDAFDEDDKELFGQVINYLQTIDEVSISLLQRKFRIGYNRSARIIEKLEAQGLIITLEGGKTRKVVR